MCAAPGGPWCSSDSRMSRMRLRMRSRLTRPSARARGPPGQVWLPRPKAMWARELCRSTRNSAGHSKRRGSRLAAPFSSITGVPAAMSIPPMDVERRARRKSAFTGLSMRSDSSTKFGISSLSARSSSLQLGALGQVLQGDGEEPGRCLLPGGEQEGGRTDHRCHVGHGAVGVGGKGQVGEHVVARIAAPVLDVAGEPVVEPRQGIEVPLCEGLGPDFAWCVVQAEPLTEALMVGFGHTEEIGYHQHGERLRVGADELTRAIAHELVEELVRQAVHELLVLLEPPRSDQPHEQCPLAGVGRGIHGDHVLVHREAGRGSGR